MSLLLVLLYCLLCQLHSADFCACAVCGGGGDEESLASVGASTSPKPFVLKTWPADCRQVALVFCVLCIIGLYDCVCVKGPCVVLFFCGPHGCAAALALDTALVGTALTHSSVLCSIADISGHPRLLWGLCTVCMMPYRICTSLEPLCASLHLLLRFVCVLPSPLDPQAPGVVRGLYVLCAHACLFTAGVLASCRPLSWRCACRMLFGCVVLSAPISFQQVALCAALQVCPLV